jgi:hypothetical protein
MFGEGRRGKKRMGSVAIKRVVKGGLRKVRECKLYLCHDMNAVYLREVTTNNFCHS